MHDLKMKSCVRIGCLLSCGTLNHFFILMDNVGSGAVPRGLQPGHERFVCVCTQSDVHANKFISVPNCVPQHSSSLCPVLWVSFTYVYILMHCFRCALKSTFEQQQQQKAKAEEWVWNITCVMVLQELEFFSNFFPLGAFPSILSYRQNGVCNSF